MNTKFDLLRALNNSKTIIKQRVPSLIEKDEWEDVFNLFEKYFKHKERIDRIVDDR